jgi:tagaturonate reductase
MSGRIIQFGTSRFLQAHVDLFVHEARQAGQAAGPITVVQSSGAADRAGRVAAFGQPYPVIIRGVQEGRAVERTITVTSIDRGLSAGRDWETLTALFAEQSQFVVSNTGDNGYDVSEADRTSSLLEGGVPVSFPAKLTALFWHRWRAGGHSMTVLPCELVPQNGRVLRELVLGLARAAGAPAGFEEWLGSRVIWADTLVDRIVSEPLEPIGAIAEPYALWAIECRPGLEPPCQHPAIILAEDLEPFERLKLHILNLGHTVLADLWLRQGRAPEETVRAILDDETVRNWLEDLYRREVVPGFARRGMGSEAESYVATTMDRFRNPFLDHRIADIAQNHPAKVVRRIVGFRDWVAEGQGGTPSMPVLETVIAGRAAAGAA